MDKRLLVATLACALGSTAQAQLLKPMETYKKAYAGGYVDGRSLGLTGAESDIRLYETKKGRVLYFRDAAGFSLGMMPGNLHEPRFDLGVQQSFGLRAKNSPLFIGASIEGIASSAGGKTERVTVAPGVEFGALGYPAFKRIDADGLLAFAFYIQNNYGFFSSTKDEVQPEYGIKIQYVGDKAVFNGRLGNRASSTGATANSDGMHWNDVRSAEYLHKVGKRGTMMLGGYVSSSNEVLLDGQSRNGVKNASTSFVGAKVVATIGR